MSNCSRLLALALCIAPALMPVLLPAQTPPKPAKTAKAPKADRGDSAKPKRPDVSKLFKSELPLEVTFTANFKALRRDRKDGAPYRPATITYVDSATGAPVQVPLRARTRGIWRLANCDFPPLRLNFPGKATKQTLFDDLDSPKMVNYCKSGGNSDQLVLQELQLYRIYRLLTPVSHQVRLLRVTYVDSASNKPELTRYAFLIEDIKRVGERVGGREITNKGATSDDLEPTLTALFSVFQYFIGNTDYSIGTLHNGEILAQPTGRMLPLPYDFDFAGAINAPYAAPAPNLRIKRVRDRQFRGYCAHKNEYPAALELFKARKAAIYALYDDAIGQLIDKSAKAQTLSFFDAFYKDTETPAIFERRVLPDCVIRM